MRSRAGQEVKRRAVAVVDEARCIGCTLCIAACPADAIVGANGMMHAVIEKYCIGCDLCVPPCPVDCIDMVPSQREWTAPDVSAAKVRIRARKSRLLAPAEIPPTAPGERRSAVDAAIARARARREAKSGPAA
jgi:electron transport complex protein RnfB